MGANIKRSRLHRWIKSVKILSDALMENFKAATRKNEIIFFLIVSCLTCTHARIMYYVALRESMFYWNNYTVYFIPEVKCLIFKYIGYILACHIFAVIRVRSRACPRDIRNQSKCCNVVILKLSLKSS